MNENGNENWIVERTNIKVSDLNYHEFLENVIVKCAFTIYPNKSDEYVVCARLGTCLLTDGVDNPELRYAIHVRYWNESAPEICSDSFVIYLETPINEFHNLYKEFLHFPEICVDCLLFDGENFSFFYSSDYHDLNTFTSFKSHSFDDLFDENFFIHIRSNEEINEILNNSDNGFIAI